MSGPRPAEIGVGEIADMLAQRIDSLCDGLHLGGKVIDGKRLPLNPTRNDRKPGSFVIDVAGNRRGRWDDFATGDYGDALDLVAYVLFGGAPISREAKREAIRWSKRWLGISDNPASSAAMAQGTAKLARARAAHEQAQARAQAMAEANLQKDRGRAFITWTQSSPLKDGVNPAWAYLVEARKIPLDQLLREHGRLPSAVRWSMQKHVETDQVVPCLVTGSWFGDGTFASIHRTFLQPDGSGKLAPAYAGMPQKKIWPRGWKGSFIPLWRGRGQLSADVAAKKGELQDLAYMEGIEDGLSVICMAPEWRCWAVMASRNFADQDPPACAKSVIAVRDRDPDRKVRARVDGYVAQLRERCEGRELPFMETFPDKGFKDFNQMLGGRG